MSDPTVASVQAEGDLPASGGDTSAPAAIAPAHDSGEGQSNEDLFFDPSTLTAPELKAAWKQMQAAYTKKTQSIKEARNKVEAYDRFASDPLGMMQQLAQQYGYEIGPRGQLQKQTDSTQSWTPNTWDEVLEKAEERATKKLLNQLQPAFTEVREVRQKQIEQTLDEQAPGWRQYEDEMSELIKSHPTLIRDPVKLARIAIPDHVIEGRAMQAALKKMEGKAQASQVSGGSTTSRQQTTNPNEIKSFDQAVAWAKEQLASQNG